MRPYIALLPSGQVKRTWKDLPAEIHLRASELLKLVDICNLSLTSKYHQGLFAEVHAHRIKVLLTKEFSIPVGPLVSEMRRLDGVIVGTFPLAVIDYEAPTPYEIDFMLPHGAFEQFAKFLLARTTYRPITHQMVPLYSSSEDSGVRRVEEFRNARARVLRVMETELSTATSAIFLLPTTAAMNYITWNSIVCPYPHMIIDHIALFNSFRASSPLPIQRFIAKYTRLGYSTYGNASLAYYGHPCQVDPYCAQTPRRIDDGNCMVVRWGAYQSPTDVVDSKLEWRLASRYRCSGATNPTGALVAPSNGECIAVRVRFNQNHAPIEVMTVIRTKRMSLYLQVIRGKPKDDKRDDRFIEPLSSTVSAAYKNVIGARRASWHTVSSIEQKGEWKGNEARVRMIKGYREKIELTKICEDISSTISAST